jgi:hypothetical protein
MSKISPTSQYSGKHIPQITPDEIIHLGEKKDYAEISTKALFFLAGVVVIAIGFAGLTIGFLAFLSVFNLHPPFARTTIIVAILGTIATVVWMRRNWRVGR